jgi:hypothetical protein
MWHEPKCSNIDAIAHIAHELPANVVCNLEHLKQALVQGLFARSIDCAIKSVGALDCCPNQLGTAMIARISYLGMIGLLAGLYGRAHQKLAEWRSITMLCGDRRGGGLVIPITR